MHGFAVGEEAQKSSTPQPNNNDDDKESRDNSLLNDNNIVKGQVIPFPEKRKSARFFKIRRILKSSKSEYIFLLCKKM
jgi:hypothetical protein